MTIGRCNILHDVGNVFDIIFHFKDEVSFFEKAGFYQAYFREKIKKGFALEALCWVMLWILHWACLCRIWYSLFQDNSEVHFKIKKTTQLKKLKQAYADRQVCVIYNFFCFIGQLHVCEGQFISFFGWGSTFQSHIEH